MIPDVPLIQIFDGEKHIADSVRRCPERFHYIFKSAREWQSSGQCNHVKLWRMHRSFFSTQRMMYSFTPWPSSIALATDRNLHFEIKTSLEAYHRTKNASAVKDQSQFSFIILVSSLQCSYKSQGAREPQWLSRFRVWENASGCTWLVVRS